MSPKQHLILKSILKDHYSPLMKAIVKQDTKSVVDITELHDSLKIVPKAILTFVVQATKDMDSNGAKEVAIPWEDNAMMLLNKQTEDAYKGHITKDGHVVHEFSLCSIPQLAAHLLSFSEMYDQVPDNGEHEESSKEDSDIEIKQHLAALDGKINALMMIIANQPMQKAEDVSKTAKLSKFLKGNQLKKAGIMPTMPKPGKPGVRDGGDSGITKEGIHSNKTDATDMPGHDLHTEVKNPWNSAFNNAAKESALPKQPKQVKEKISSPSTAPAMKSEEELDKGIKHAIAGLGLAATTLMGGQANAASGHLHQFVNGLGNLPGVKVQANFNPASQGSLDGSGNYKIQVGKNTIIGDHLSAGGNTQHRVRMEGPLDNSPDSQKAKFLTNKLKTTGNKLLERNEKELTFRKSELLAKCTDCGAQAANCYCFKALSKPVIKKSENDKITLKFNSDWDSDAIAALYKSVRRWKHE